jgi:hypothetical protein
VPYFYQLKRILASDARASLPLLSGTMFNFEHSNIDQVNGVVLDLADSSG